jgi:hypothetical protein
VIGRFKNVDCAHLTTPNPILFRRTFKCHAHIAVAFIGFYHGSILQNKIFFYKKIHCGSNSDLNKLFFPC